MDMAIGGLNGAAGKIQEAAPANAAPAGSRPAAPGAGDVERFQAAYENGAAARDAAGTAPAAPMAVEGASVGDRILGGIARVSDKIGADRAEVANVLERDDAGQADLLRAQFRMIESSTLISAVGKTAEKINQGVKTLQQG